MKQFKALLYLIAAIAIVAILAVRIYVSQSGLLNRAEHDCAKGKAVLLNGSTAPGSFANLMTSRSYVQSEEEASFIARHTIGCIQKEGGQPGSIRDLGHERYGLELDSTGFTSIVNLPYLSARAEQLAGGHGIDPGKCPVPDASVSEKYVVKIREKDGGLHRDTVYLCVREHFNEVVEKDGKTIDCHSRDSVYAWIPVCGTTDICLPVRNAGGIGRYFSVIPVERGFVFGSSRGTYQNRRHAFKFVRRRAVLPLLGKGILKQMREDNSVLVRSPQEYRDKFISTIALFGALWILAFLFLAVIDKKRGGKSNLELLAVAALLSGMGLVNLFNLQNPLWGELFAWSQLQKGLMLGLALMVICALLDWTGLYRYSYWAHLSSGKRGIQGLWMAIVAIGIALVLLLFGHGPGGTHVTLPLIPVQGSPLIKILVMGYMAVVFASRGDLLEAYTKPGKLWKQITVLVTVIVALLVLGMLQLMISDLGPFLVIAITAIIIFSLYTKETVSMLIGTGTFSVILLLGNRYIHYEYLPFVLFVVYSAIWALLSYYRHGRVKLSPIILGLVVLLAFHGGTIFKLVGKDDIAARLDGRTEIVASIFDNEVVGGSQIAEGVWAVARGGILGKPETGLASTLPAGHTDLAFESLAENMGVLGGIVVLVSLAFLLYTTLKIGIRNGHPFGFAMGSLIALSVGIQAVLIILGSLGIIPLTGVTLPFISYGGTALAVDLASIGILISLSRNKDYELECMNTQRFAAMSVGQLWAYIVLALIAMAVILNYGCFSRKKYMVAPGKFINNSGERIPLMNPLIDVVKKQLIPGDILDRNGNVLATTNEDGTRSYPYAEYTLLTVGDLPTKVLWGSAGKKPAGLLAEERYESPIRGYETHPVNLAIKSSRHYSHFLPDVPMNKEESVRIEDYSALLPMMLSQKEIRKWNERQAERNIQLTIDAELQMELSMRAALFAQEMRRLGKTNDRTRISIVAMDAADGSLLTSAMYPLADPSILKGLARTNTTTYRDWTQGFKAYIDMDLGLVPLAPGSTSKLFSTGAGLVRFSTDLAGETFNQMVYRDEIVDISLGEPTGSVSLKQAIVLSSNVYFIKLLNSYGEAGLYPELAGLFYAVGASFGTATPYTLYPDQVLTAEQSYRTQVESFGRTAAKKFEEYEESGERHRLIDAEFQPAWGQGMVSMTPLALCRYVAACAQGGTMMYPRYEAGDSVRVYRQLMSAEEAQVLQYCMKGQAAGRFGEISTHIGGKTGTPSRADRSKGMNGKSNDALYCFFVDAEGTTSGHPIAVVIRLERVNDYSRLAIRMADEVVIPVLKEKGYIL